MPRILITGLPTDGSSNAEALQHLLTVRVPLAVESVEGFGISHEHVYVHALPDLVTRSRIVVMFSVDGLLAKPERTAAMRQTLVRSVAESLVCYLNDIGAPYEAVVGWCGQIDREDDGFIRRSPQKSQSS